MKKLINILVTTSILCSTSFALGASDIKCLRLDDIKYQDFQQVIMASKKQSNEIIPFSMAQYDKYLYTYVKEECDIEIRYEEGAVFWDADEWDFYLKEFSARGVIKGYEDGSARPYNNITKAEVATILAKLFSMDMSDDTPYFEDTAKDDWYIRFVTGLYNQGVIPKEDKFYPNKWATREEIVTMIYNILEKEGFLKKLPSFDFSDYVDVDNISNYAKEAYEALYSNGYRAMEDYSQQGLEEEQGEIKCLLNPQKTVEREQCIEFLYAIMRDIFSKNAPFTEVD